MGWIGEVSQAEVNLLARSDKNTAFSEENSGGLNPSPSLPRRTLCAIPSQKRRYGIL